MPTDPRAPLSPQVKVLFDMMAAGRATRVLEPKALREGLGALTALLVAGAPAVAAERTIEIPGAGGKIRARVFWPGDPKRGPYPVFVFFHGGGYVAMSPETHEKLTKQLCVGVGAVVVSVDYRLAPEHRYPAPLDDCLAAYRWVRANAKELGGDSERLLAGGDSAGGNATAAVALRLIAAGEPLPRALLLLCPWLDMALDTDSMRTFGPDDGVLDTDIMTFFRDCTCARRTGRIRSRARCAATCASSRRRSSSPAASIRCETTDSSSRRSSRPRAATCHSRASKACRTTSCSSRASTTASARSPRS